MEIKTFARTLRPLAVWSLALLAWLPMAQAQIIMFDFGPTTPTGSNLTNSPGHTTTAVPLAQTTWNLVGMSDVTSGLLYANGASASGISILTGRELIANSGSIDFTANPDRSLALGSAIDTGIYSGDSVAKDGIFHSVDNFAIGVQIQGLAAGTYDIYLSGRNTNVSPSPGSNFYAAASSLVGPFSFGSLSASSATNPNGTGLNTWTSGGTYARLTVTLTEGQVLNIASEGAGTGSAGRGFLNSMQIVAVPEPSAPVLFGLGLAGFVLLRRRRHSA